MGQPALPLQISAELGQWLHHRGLNVHDQQPGYIPALDQLGNAWQQLRESDKAIACYQKVLEINPNVAAAYCNLGCIWQMQGKFEEAIAAYQRAITIKPDFALAHRNLSELFASQW